MERSLLFLPLLIKTLVLLDKGPTLMTSFNLNYLPLGPVPQCSHIGVGASNAFGEDTV